MHISWNLKLIGKDDIEEGDRRVVGPSDPATAKSDIGFTVLLRKRDGTLPMLIPYKYGGFYHECSQCCLLLLIYCLYSGEFVSP